MTSQNMPESEPSTTDEFDLEPPATNALPVLPTVFGAYRFVGDHLVAFIAVAALVGAVHFSIMRLVPSVLASVYPNLPPSTLLGAAGILLLPLASIVYAFAGVRWCHGIVLGRGRGQRRGFNARVAHFALGAIVFGLLLEVLSTLPVLDASEQELGIGDWAERKFSLPAYRFWQIALGLLRVLATSFLFLGLAATAVGADRPLRRGATMAWHNLRFVYAVFFVGLVPWMAVQGLELIPWLAFAIMGLAVMTGPEPVWVLVLTLDAWLTTTSIALGASVYRTLSQTDTSAETADVFD